MTHDQGPLELSGLESGEFLLTLWDLWDLWGLRCS